MAIRVGIGIITCNRKDVLAETLARVRAHTTAPFTLAVADDGSTDGTTDLVRSQNVTLVTGRNMGIAWNKNRALFLLSHMLGCEAVILLEDDTRPTQSGWEAEWVLAHPTGAPRRVALQAAKSSQSMTGPIHPFCDIARTACAAGPLVAASPSTTPPGHRAGRPLGHGGKEPRRALDRPRF